MKWWLLGVLSLLITSCSMRDTKDSDSSAIQYMDTAIFNRIFSIPNNSTVTLRDYYWYNIEFDEINIKLREGAIPIEELEHELSLVVIHLDTMTEYKKIYYGYSEDNKLFYVAERKLKANTLIGKGLYGYMTMTCELDDIDLEQRKDRIVRRIFATYLARLKRTPYGE